MDADLAKVYYSPQSYWRGISAIKKLVDAAKVPEETAPRRDTFHGPNSTYQHLTRSTKRTFFFCLMRNSLVAAKYTNTC